MNPKISAFCNDALGHMDATATAQAIASGKVSVQEVTEAAIKRAEAVNPQLNALVIKTYDQARNQQQLKKGGIFYGVPAAVKDNDHIAGLPTQKGTGAFVAPKARKNSAFVNQFLSSGLSCLGKTSLPEFGLICSTENEKWGVTRNPWNPDYTTGGSSSGSAALVAAGVVPIATANDGAGSIRIPASCCGLVGLKPSRSRLLPLEGSELIPLQIVHQGVLSRSVRDTANFFYAAEQFYRNRSLPAIGQVQHPTGKKLKFVFFEYPSAAKAGHLDADTQRVQDETAALLRALGHQINYVPLPVDVDEMASHYLHYYGFLAYMMSHWGRLSVQAKVDKSQLEPFTLGLAREFRAKPFRLASTIKTLRETGRRTEELFRDYDVVVTPVTAHRTPPIGHFSVSLPYEQISRRAVEYAAFCGLQNVTGSPAISLPLGTDGNGLPMGVQFSSKFGEDKLLLELAFELEEAKPWKLLG